MAYYDTGPPNRLETVPPHPHHAPYEGQYTQSQGPTTPMTSYSSPNHGFQPPNGQYDPRHAPINASHQHRPLSNTQNRQQAPQKAYAVAIPQPSLSFNVENGYAATPISRPQHPQVVPSPTSFHPLHGYPSDPPQQQKKTEPPLDYQLLLLSLAEEYFAAARGYGAVAAALQRETDMREYYKLIATGLGCLEAVLGRLKLLPEREAIVRLRYATILYEETENIMVAEEALSKGISLCDRHRFFDLKYNMQHLLARMLFAKSPRAAFKFLDGVVKDVEAYQHVAWIYAFRFLQVSLHSKLSTHQDTLSALAQLRHVINMSNDYGDKAVLAIATTIEALTCLRESSDEDSIEQAQRALAGVRSLQLDPKIGELHQLTVLTSIVDLCCHLQQFDPGQALAKMQIMQTALKNMDASKSWVADGSFAIPVAVAKLPSCKSQNGIIRKDEDGSSALMFFSWMSKDDVYNLGYLLSGIALAHRNTQDGQKSERMLEEGIKRMKYAHNDRSKPALPRSISLATLHQRWHAEMTCYMRLHLAFTLCARTSWLAAKDQQSLIRTYIQSVTASSQSVTEPLHRLSIYLEAVIYQGTGSLDQALTIYESDACSIENYRKTQRPSQLHRDVALLSALNTLLIIRTATHSKHEHLSSLLPFIEKLCIRNPNRQIQSAFHLVTATTSSSSTILHTKQALQSALQTAKSTENNQLMCMLLNLMSWRFFRGVVGEQSEKSAMASQTQAQKCMDTLWMSVSAGALGDTFEAAGKIEEAKKARDSGQTTAATLPETLQAAMRRNVA